MTVVIILLATGAALAILLLSLGLAPLAGPGWRTAVAAPGSARAGRPDAPENAPGHAQDDRDSVERPSLWQNVLVPAGQRLRRRARRYLPRNLVATYSARLVGAGSPHGLTGAQFLALKLVAPLAGLVLGGAAGGAVTLLGHPGTWPLTLLLGLVAGLVLPDVWLGVCRRAHVAAVYRMLPSTIDLLLVAMEAGLTFDRAVAYAVTAMQGALGTELHLYLVQRRLGLSTSEALDLVAQRVQERDMSRFLDLVSQSQQHGLPMSKALGAFADDLRTRRRQEATERAQGAAIKILLPVVVFILPAIFVIVLAPALAHLSGNLGP